MILIDYFYLKPNELSNIDKSILVQVQKKCENYCSQEVGYVTEFIRVVRILNNFINRNGLDIIFRVEFEVETFKPNVDDIYNATIIGMFSDGILLVYNKMKILIPKTNLIENNYVFEDGVYNNLNIGETVDIIITQIKYEKNNFMCIANLK